ncbi:UbiX family flavin prenyltransferase [Aeoliella sp. ICT_H6.2]|uniref:Flavin prenyltransferase UbiX n=1 Tax=Aeoliella straminimaris TaxID=2954799 RepID=A0A9X2JH42_9BACT|nr:flavin prenyltransferase UbiX [Aeoliella straminimaris]MCO6045655.1 UbiX family flavin prenyltransferase [Aeoliella straminimaris]
MNRPIVVGITGASGAAYSVRLIEVLLTAGRDVHLSISPSGREVIRQELDLHVDLEDFTPDSLLLGAGRSTGGNTLAEITEVSTGDSNVLGSGMVRRGQLHYHHYQDFMSSPASGSFLTGGMVVCPCSGTTLSAIAAGMAGNLIQRAAEVHLKERRRLVLTPRETPLSLPAIDNMRRATEAGAVVLPASPGFYQGVESVKDLVDFIVARILDQLGIENELIDRWGEA